VARARALPRSRASVAAGSRNRRTRSLTLGVLPLDSVVVVVLPVVVLLLGEVLGLAAPFGRDRREAAAAPE